MRLVYYIFSAAEKYKIPIKVFASLVYSETFWNSDHIEVNGNNSYDYGVAQTNVPYNPYDNDTSFMFLINLAPNDEANLDLGASILASKQNRDDWLKKYNVWDSMDSGEKQDYWFKAVINYKSHNLKGLNNARDWKKKHFDSWPSPLKGKSVVQQMKMNAWETWERDWK